METRFNRFFIEGQKLAKKEKNSLLYLVLSWRLSSRLSHIFRFLIIYVREYTKWMWMNMCVQSRIIDDLTLTETLSLIATNNTKEREREETFDCVIELRLCLSLCSLVSRILFRDYICFMFLHRRCSQLSILQMIILQ